MIRTLFPGATSGNESGYVLLRGLLIMFIVLLCFASLLGGITIVSHRSAIFLEQAEKEIISRNEAVKNLLK